MTTLEHTQIAAELDLATRGNVFEAGSAGYTAQVSGYNVAIVHEPVAVLVAVDAQDVAAAVRFAAHHGLKVAVKSTGHSASAVLADTILISTSAMDSVTIDHDSRTATIDAGTRWQRVLDAAAPHGLGALAGSSTTVGAVGYTLGGGMSPIGRTFGYAADHVRSIEVVTADGVVRRVDDTHDSELFWALRGGGAAFGIVTEMVIDLFPIQTLYAGGIFFDIADAAAVLRAWQLWVPTLPDSASTSVAILNLPPLPTLPEPLRGRTVLHLRFAHVSDTENGQALLAPMRSVAPAIIDGVAEICFAALAQIHMDPIDPMPAMERGVLLADLTDETIEAFLRAAEMPLAVAELRALGGAYARRPHSPNAVGSRDAAFNLIGIGVLAPEIAHLVPGVLDGFVGSFDRWSTGAAFMNMAGSATGVPAEKVRAGWDEDTLGRLLTLRGEVDPDGMFAPAARW